MAMTTLYQDLARASVLDRLWHVRYAFAGDLCVTGTDIGEQLVQRPHCYEKHGAQPS